LGKGPVIAIGPNITPAIYESLVKTAKENRIPYQIRAEGRGTGTDANAIQLSRSGVATGLVSIPNRYMHSPCEMVDLEDVENAIKLLARFCEKNIGSLLKSE
jgi:endoglucanase